MVRVDGEREESLEDGEAGGGGARAAARGVTGRFEPAVRNMDRAQRVY